MNRKELERARRENLNKLDTAFRPKINAVEVDINNSIKHELAKVFIFWMLRHGVPAQCLERDWTGINIIDCHELEQIAQAMTGYLILNFGQKFKHEWERPQVITEARFDKNKQKDFCYNLKKPFKEQQRRADIFILDTGEIVEIETNPKVKKEGDNVITVRI